MKKIVIIDGGPRLNMNTAMLLQRFAEGAKSVGSDVDVKTIRLYDLDFKGCMSCIVCKLKGKASHVCCFKDALTPVLNEIAQADGSGGKIRPLRVRWILRRGQACMA